MPNFEYDTRTPEEKKKLMRGKLPFDAANVDSKDAPHPEKSGEDTVRGPLHRHTA